VDLAAVSGVFLTALVGALLIPLIGDALAIEGPGCDFEGRVVEVLAGDRLRVMRDGRPVELRLWGVVCPEAGQPFAKAAREFTSGCALARMAKIRVVSHEETGRLCGCVTLETGADLGKALVRAGLARSDARQGDVADLAALEEDARSGRKGLWGEPASAPAPEAARGGAAAQKPEAPAAAGPWKRVFGAKDCATAHGDVVADKQCPSGLVFEAEDHRPRALFVTPLFDLPAPGRYRAVFRFAVLREERYANYYNRVVLMALEEQEKDLDGKHARGLNKAELAAAALSRAYGEYSLEFEAVAPRLTVRLALWKVGLVLRVEAVTVTAVGADGMAAAGGAAVDLKPGSADTQNGGNETVVVTREGRKYHRPGCRLARRGGVSLTVTEACLRGYTPCAVCRPPAGEGP